MAEVKNIATRDSYGATLQALAAEHPELVVLDADLVGLHLHRHVPESGPRALF